MDTRRSAPQCDRLSPAVLARELRLGHTAGRTTPCNRHSPVLRPQLSSGMLYRSGVPTAGVPGHTARTVLGHPHRALTLTRADELKKKKKSREEISSCLSLQMWVIRTSL